MNPFITGYSGGKPIRAVFNIYSGSKVSPDCRSLPARSSSVCSVPRGFKSQPTQEERTIPRNTRSILGMVESAISSTGVNRAKVAMPEIILQLGSEAAISPRQSFSLVGDPKSNPEVAPRLDARGRTKAVCALAFTNPAGSDSVARIPACKIRGAEAIRMQRSSMAECRSDERNIDCPAWERRQRPLRADARRWPTPTAPIVVGKELRTRIRIGTRGTIQTTAGQVSQHSLSSCRPRCRNCGRYLSYFAEHVCHKAHGGRSASKNHSGASRPCFTRNNSKILGRRRHPQAAGGSSNR